MTDQGDLGGFERGPNYARGIFLVQLFMVLVTILVGKPHTMLHEMSWPIPRPEEVAAFDFVGGSGPEGPSIWAVLLECAAWSFAGFVARAQYFLTLLALGKVQSMPLIQVGSKLIGEAAAGISIAVALVALLWSSELTVLEIQMSLRNVGVGSVIAVSFVLGFFHDDSREILRRAGSRLFARD